MPKVRITQAPKGVTGSQSNYGLVRKTNVSTTNKADRDVKNTMTALKGDDVEKANIEVEGGETVLGDINKDGHLELFEFKGKRHSQGGMPVDIPEGAFIFSDTPKLKIKDKKMLKEYFGLNSKKGGYTPAEISKKYQINKFMDILKDPESDEMAKRSANEMVKKNMQKLGILAFIQELQKGIPDGIPDISMMAFSELGLDPNQLLQEAMPQQPQQGMTPPQQMPMAKYGRQLKYPDGGNTPPDAQSKQVFDDYYHYLYDRLNQVYGQDFLESKPPEVNQGAYDLISNLLVWKDDRKIPNDPEMMSMVEAIKSADILPDDEIKTILSYDISKKLGMLDKASLWASLSGDTLEKFQEFRDYVKGAREEGFTFRDGGGYRRVDEENSGSTEFGKKKVVDVYRPMFGTSKTIEKDITYASDDEPRTKYTEREVTKRYNDDSLKSYKLIRKKNNKMIDEASVPKLRFKKGTVPFNLVQRDGGKIPDDVLRSRLESHMSPSEASAYLDSYKKGGRKMVKRADGSYSPWGLWDSIRANKGSGKAPTKEMLKQERKIRKAEYGEEVNPYAGRSYHINETGDGNAKYYATFGDKMRNFLKMKPRIGGVRFEYGGLPKAQNGLSDRFVNRPSNEPIRYDGPTVYGPLERPVFNFDIPTPLNNDPFNIPESEFIDINDSRFDFLYDEEEQRRRREERGDDKIPHCVNCAKWDDVPPINIQTWDETTLDNNAESDIIRRRVYQPGEKTFLQKILHPRRSVNANTDRWKIVEQKVDDLRRQGVSEERIEQMRRQAEESMRNYDYREDRERVLDEKSGKYRKHGGMINPLSKFVGGGELPMYQNAGYVIPNTIKDNYAIEDLETDVLVDSFDSWDDLQNEINNPDEDAAYRDALQKSVQAFEYIQKGDYNRARTIANDILDVDLGHWYWPDWGGPFNSREDRLQDISAAIERELTKQAANKLDAEQVLFDENRDVFKQSLIDAYTKVNKGESLTGDKYLEFSEGLQEISDMQSPMQMLALAKDLGIDVSSYPMLMNDPRSTYHHLFSGMLGGVDQEQLSQNLSTGEEIGQFVFNLIPYRELASFTYGMTHPTNVMNDIAPNFIDALINSSYNISSYKGGDMISHEDKQYKVGDNGAWLVNVGKGDRPSWSKVTDKNIIDALNKKIGRFSTTPVKGNTTVKSNTTVNGGGNGGGFNPEDL